MVFIFTRDSDLRTDLRCRLLACVALLWLAVLIISCGKEESSTTRHLVAIEDRIGQTLMSFDYEGCDLIGIEYVQPLIVDLAPIQYPDPLRDNSVARERVTCRYSDGNLRQLTIIDELRTGVSRSRTYTAVYAEGKLSRLMLTEEIPARPGTPLNRDLSYYYDDKGRVDSIIYGLYYSAAYTYDESDNITYAQYRDPSLTKSTEEFYGYAGAQGANPLLATPLRLIQPYASYWSAQPVVQATFGLRSYGHVTESGRVVESVDLTIGDSLALQRYVYSDLSCL